jgi:hypothetical protein
MIILCWTTKHDEMIVDHYTTFESIDDAEISYGLIKQCSSVTSASLCKPIASTEPHYLD